MTFDMNICRGFKKMLLANMARKKEAATHKESKFKAFIKRSSEPLMAMQTQQVVQKIDL